MIKKSSNFHVFLYSTPEGRKIKGDTEAARALNYSRRISLYEFSRAHIVRPAELVQRNPSRVIERSGRLSIPLERLIHRSQLSFS